MSDSSSTNTSSGSTPANRVGEEVISARRPSGRQLELVLPPDLVQRRALGGGAAGAMGGGHQVLWFELDAVVAACHARDRLLHQRSAEIVNSPAQRLGGGVEAHLDPAGLEVADAPTESEAEDGGVLEVLLAGDLLDPVGAAEQRVEGDERQRDELGDASGALLELAHHP